MPLGTEDRTTITERLSMHGHVFDAGELDRLDDLFTADVVYDISDFGHEPLWSESPPTVRPRSRWGQRIRSLIKSPTSSSPSWTTDGYAPCPRESGSTRTARAAV